MKRDWLTQEQNDELDKYDEWAKTNRKQVIVEDYKGIHQNGNKVLLCVRNDDKEIRIGDVLGGQTILAISAYGKDLDSLSPGTTGAITLDGMPVFIVQETYPDFAKWLYEQRQRNDRARISGDCVTPLRNMAQASPEDLG